jgi:threonyl-tRNA synthetase
MDIKITFPDKNEQVCSTGVTAAEVIGGWDRNALDNAVAAKVNGSIVDLALPLMESAVIEPVDTSSKEGLSVLRHSISHVMAQAVQDVFKGAKVTIGPSIEDGFYYDFEYSETFTLEDFEKIENRMKEIVAADYPFIREEMPREKAVELFRQMGEDYKVELINDLPADVSVVSIYKDGDYVDLCRGPHIPSTGRIKAFKLLSVAGAYWRGDERNKMLQRIYGTGFADRQALEDYLNLLERLKKETIAAWAENWIFSRSMTRQARAWSSFIPRACCFATSSKSGKEKNI